MASKQAYLDYVLEQLSDLDEISHRAMMGEFILYYQGKIIGGIYDNRLLVKDIPAARRLMPDAAEEIPYEGAKPMLLVENIDDKAFVCALWNAMAEALPEPKPKKPRRT